MNIMIYGLGYVGAVSAGCLCSLGHRVVGVEIDEGKLERLKRGVPPVKEPGLEDLFLEGLRTGRLLVNRDPGDAFDSTQIFLVAVGTPSNADGTVDTGAVVGLCRSIAERLKQGGGQHKTVVIRSTVPPRVLRDEVIPQMESLSELKEGRDFSVVANPEFLREGSAVADFFDPFGTVLGIGEGDSEAEAACRELYQSVDAPIYVVAREAAFMMKYASNAYHALKVAFANEVGIVCDHLGINSRAVMALFCEDDRLNISRSYLRPGFAFGGSCLPKDLRALQSRFGGGASDLSLIPAIMESNQRLIARAVEEIEVLAEGGKVALLGVAFKPGTDDLRESPYATIASQLAQNHGLGVQVFDELAFDGESVGVNAKLRQQLILDGVKICDSMHECVRDATVVVIAHPGPEVRDVLTGTGGKVVDLSGDQDLQGVELAQYSTVTAGTVAR